MPIKQLTFLNPRFTMNLVMRTSGPTRIKILSSLFFLTGLFLIGIGYAHAFNLPKWFPFNKKDALEEWEEKVFRNRVLYTVEVRPGTGYLSAKSRAAASGLFHRIKFSPRKFPMLSWKWRVLVCPDKQRAGQRKEKQNGWIEKDDYAARFHVIFYNWNFMNIKSLEYVWDDPLPKGTILTSPFFKNIKLIVAESGKNAPDQWRLEERNIYEDYAKAFGRPPATVVGAIALMTNADNTASTAEAEYKEVRVGYVK